MSSSPPAWLQAAAAVLVLVILGSHGFIDLELALAIPLPGGRSWQANAPMADVAALALLPLALLGAGRARPPLPGPWGWGLLLLASALSLRHAIDPGLALHHLLRKPLLVYAIYGLGLSWAVARLVPSPLLDRALQLALALIAGVSLVTSAGRILAGDTLWFQRIEGLTPNHKTLAICLAGWLPLLLGQTRRAGLRPGGATLVLFLVGLALLSSLSKTALIGAVVALAWQFPLARPIAWRPRAFLPVLALAVALAYYAPVLLQSRTMLDAARSRHSLDLRSWEMFQAHPLVGAGSGMSTVYEMVTFPHYRVNGVDAHGVLQKTAAETGLLGLLGLGLFLGGVGRALLGRWRAARARAPASAPARLLAYDCLGVFVVLHSLLLLSTEVFSPTHWVPLAVAWGIAWRAADPPPVVEAPCAY